MQHEYGLYSGRDGEAIIEVVATTDTPSIVVAHTVLGAPTPHQRAVLEAVARATDAMVVMTEAGRARLSAGFDVDMRKVSVIPHGAAISVERPSSVSVGRPNILTWGLLGPGKGIEWAIDAVALLGDLRPSPHYCIAGDTHPKVVAAHGEEYRDMLRARVARLGIESSVRFDGGYRGLDDLAKMIADSSIVVLPYDSPDQVTSGVLVDAVAAGRPVVATAFPHAQELLASGAGIVVPRCDPGALAAALRELLTEPDMLDAMSAEARRIAPGLAWPVVAAKYSDLSAGAPWSRCSGVSVTASTPSFDHLMAITNRFGTYEHAEGAVPRPEHGYCTDDVARVLVLRLPRTAPFARHHRARSPLSAFPRRRPGRHREITEPTPGQR